MSSTTTTTTPSPAVAPTPSKAAAASAIVVNHHPIIILLVICALVWFLAGKVETAWSNHEARVFTAQNAQLAAQAQANNQQAVANAALAEKNAMIAAQYEAMVKQYQQDLASIQAATKKQQAIDKTLSPDDLATHWDALIKSASGVHPVTGGYQVNQDAAVATVQALDSIPGLDTEVANDEKLLAQQDGLTTGLNEQITGLQTQVTGLQTQNAEEIKTCQADINKQVSALKAQQHKKSLKYLLFGGAIVEGVRIYLTHSL